MPELPNWFVCVMGIGTVFISLIILILVCVLLSRVTNGLAKADKKSQATAPVSPVAPVAQAPAVIENRGEFVAAVSAALAEELGTDVTGIRILSIKKL